MESQQYLVLSERTERKFPEGMALTPLQAETLHHTLGVVTEAGELADAIKRHLIYGKELDRVNVLEEIGDVLWYIAGVLRLYRSDFAQEMARNIAKLQVRFPGKFTADEALIRDLESERRILEGADFAASLIAAALPKPAELSQPDPSVLDLLKAIRDDASAGLTRLKSQLGGYAETDLAAIEAYFLQLEVFVFGEVSRLRRSPTRIPLDVLEDNYERALNTLGQKYPLSCEAVVQLVTRLSNELVASHEREATLNQRLSIQNAKAD